MPREFLNSVAIRTVVIWTALRILVVGATRTLWSPVGLIVATALTVALVLVDTEVKQERIYLANLGVGRRRIVGVSVALIVLIEAALGIIARVGYPG